MEIIGNHVATHSWKEWEKTQDLMKEGMREIVWRKGWERIKDNIKEEMRENQG